MHLAGDPTVFDNFQPHPKVIDSVMETLKNGAHNGYGPSNGHEMARKAVAEHVSRPGAKVTEKVSSFKLAFS